MFRCWNDPIHKKCKCGRKTMGRFWQKNSGLNIAGKTIGGMWQNKEWAEYGRKTVGHLWQKRVIQ